jgi:hypothetical protein
MEMSAQSCPLISLAVIVKACMSCGSVVAVSNPVQNITVYMWFIFYHLRLTRLISTPGFDSGNKHMSTCLFGLVCLEAVTLNVIFIHFYGIDINCASVLRQELYMGDAELWEISR